MIRDSGRFNAYAKAISQAVSPGCVVAEIGTGPGVFALLACRAGARRVYAIEPDDVIQVARRLAARNGLTDRIEFFQSDSRKAHLPERVNVIVSDIRGALPLLGTAIPSIEDARQRFLAPGGILIPQRDVLKAAVIEAHELYNQLASPWRDVTDRLDLSPALPLVLNSIHGGSFKTEQLLTDPVTWGVLDYTAGASPRAAAELCFRAKRRGTAHGLCLWFEAQLLGDIGYSSGPGGTATIYEQLFLPWLEAVTLTDEQEIDVRLHADLVGEDYVWRWETCIRASSASSGIHFQQSTFQGASFSPPSLRRRAGDFVPALSDEGQADRWLLQAMDGRATLQEIAQLAFKHFPQVFSSYDDALHRAGELAEKLSC